MGGVMIRELGIRRRLVIRLNGFSSTLRRRILWRASWMGKNGELHWFEDQGFGAGEPQGKGRRE